MKKGNRWVLIFLLLPAVYSNGQTLRSPVTAVYSGLGAYSFNQLDVFSFISNQASLAELKTPSLGIYGERRFLMKELNNYVAVLAFPTASGNFGFQSGYDGFVDYNETQLGLAYARKLGTKVDIGAQFNYRGIRIAGYGNSSAISFELGTILHLSDRLQAGIQVNNPGGGKFGKEQQEKISSDYSFGLGYDASAKFFVGAEIEKEENQPVNVNAGLQYKMIPQLMVKVGISSATSTLSAGLGLTFKSFRLDLTTSYHPQLGITPGLLMLFNFKAKAK